MVGKLMRHHKDSQDDMSTSEFASKLAFGNEYNEKEYRKHQETVHSQPDSQRQCMIMLTYITTQLIVEFAKKVPGFEMLKTDKQVANLKAAASEIMILRTADRYMVEEKKILFQDNSLVDRAAFNSLISEECNYVDPMFNLCDR